MTGLLLALQLTAAATLCDGLNKHDALVVHPEPMRVATWEGYVQTDDRTTQSYRTCGGALDSIVIWANPANFTEGDLQIRVYEHAGVYGQTSRPANTALRVNAPTRGWVAASLVRPLTRTSMGPGIKAYVVRFSGDQRIVRPAGTPLVFSVDWRPTGPLRYDRSNTIMLHANFYGGHPGNMYNDAPCTTAMTCALEKFDLHFAVYEER